MSSTAFQPDLSLAAIFPRNHYDRLSFYAEPSSRPHSRLLWAARDASAEWARSAAQHDWDTLDDLTFRLAVFDKTYELNQAQWATRPRPTPSEWQDQTNGLMAVAYLSAGRALRDAGQLARVPPERAVLDFCRTAMDVCAVPFIDNGPRKPSPFTHDTLATVLGAYDPLVRHAALLAASGSTDTASFVYQPDTGVWVLDDDVVPALSSDKSQDSSPRHATRRCSQASSPATPPPSRPASTADLMLEDSRCDSVQSERPPLSLDMDK